MKGNGITADPAIARDLRLCSAQTRCLFFRLAITAGDTEMSVSSSPLAASRLGGELLDGGEMLPGDHTFSYRRGQGCSTRIL